MNILAIAKTKIASALLAMLSISASYASEEATLQESVCFATALTDAIESTAKNLAMRSDALVHVQLAKDGAPREIYLLTRQVALIERIQRRSLARMPFASLCQVSLDGLMRDFEVVKTVSNAFVKGNQALEVKAITTAEAQPYLKEIVRLISILEVNLAALKFPESAGDE
jgi:hypothetical protein